MYLCRLNYVRTHNKKMNIKMRAIAVASVLLSATAIMQADVIVTKNGETLNVYNIEVASNCVFYTEEPSTDSPIHKIVREKVFGVKIGDGEMQPLEDGKQSEMKAHRPETSGPQFIEPVAADDNDEIIESYNGFELEHKGKKPKPDKNAHEFISIWEIEPSSIMSDQNVEIGFEPIVNKDGVYQAYNLFVKNKTNSPIYVDLATSYRILNGDFAEPYFTNSIYSQSSGSHAGGSVNLGAVAGAAGIGGALGTLASGINVGGGNSSSSSISTQEQRILTIPPHSSITMPGRKVTNGKKILECAEVFYFMNNSSLLSSNRTSNNIYARSIYNELEAQKYPDNPRLTRKGTGIGYWTQIYFTAENSPKTTKRMITYSTKPDFSTYTTLPIYLYMSGAYGLDSGSLSKVQKLYTAPNYNINKEGTPLVGSGWLGK